MVRKRRSYPVRRRPPIAHNVRGHNRGGHSVGGYSRGSGSRVSTVSLSRPKRERINPKRPPKKWFDKMVKDVKKRDARIEDPDAVVGDIWYNQLTERKRDEILRRYE